MPLLTITLGMVWCEVDFTNLQHHLHPNVPVFSLQIYEDGAFVTAVAIQPLFVGSLFRRTESKWFAVDEGMTPEADEVDTLVLVTGCLQVYEGAIKEREKLIDEYLHLSVQS